MQNIRQLLQRAGLRDAHPLPRTEQLHAGGRSFFEHAYQRCRGSGREAERRVMHPWILQFERDLHEQAAGRCLLQEAGELRVFEGVALVAGMEPDRAHPVPLVAAAQVFLPVRPHRVHAADRHKQAVAFAPALLRQPLIHPGKVLAEQPLETSRPRLSHAMPSQFDGERRGAVVFQAPEWPGEEMDVRVDQCDGGLHSRGRGRSRRSAAGRRGGGQYGGPKKLTAIEWHAGGTRRAIESDARQGRRHGRFVRCG